MTLDNKYSEVVDELIYFLEDETVNWNVKYDKINKLRYQYDTKDEAIAVLSSLACDPRCHRDIGDHIIEILKDLNAVDGIVKIIGNQGEVKNHIRWNAIAAINLFILKGKEHIVMKTSAKEALKHTFLHGENQGIQRHAVDCLEKLNWKPANKDEQVLYEILTGKISSMDTTMITKMEQELIECKKNMSDANYDEGAAITFHNIVKELSKHDELFAKEVLVSLSRIDGEPEDYGVYIERDLFHVYIDILIRSGNSFLFDMYAELLESKLVKVQNYAFEGLIFHAQEGILDILMEFDIYTKLNDNIIQKWDLLNDNLLFTFLSTEPEKFIEYLIAGKIDLNNVYPFDTEYEMVSWKNFIDLDSKLQEIHPSSLDKLIDFTLRSENQFEYAVTLFILFKAKNQRFFEVFESLLMKDWTIRHDVTTAAKELDYNKFAEIWDRTEGL